MLNFLRKLKVESDFKPNIISFILNPFYIVRSDLYNHIKVLALRLDGNILDVGCGSKPYQNLFINKLSYVGLEYESSVLIEKKIQVEHTYKGDKFPFEDQKFDSIVCFQVLEHVFNPEQFIGELNRVVKCNGKVLLTVPFVWDEHEQPYDFGRYSSYGLKALFERKGFKVIEQFKSTTGFRAVLQLIMLSIYKALPKNKIVKYLIIPIPNILVNLLSLIFSERANDFYLDNIILLEKV